MRAGRAIRPTPTDPAATTAGIPVVAAGDLRYTCGGRFAFGAGILDRQGADERAGDPLAAALRAHLAKPDMDIDWLPDTGWTLVGRDATDAEFVARGGESGFFAVGLSFAGGRWDVTGWGGCTPTRLLPDGLGEATWVLAPGQHVGPDTTSFEALVTERDCASGQSADRRTVGPDVLAAGDSVLVTFAVRALGGGQTCQGNPSTRVVVTLREPLGDRRLMDGSVLPPREPVAED